MLNAASDMDFAHTAQVDFSEKLSKRKALVVCVAAKIIDIEQNFTSCIHGELIKKGRFRHLRRGIRQQVDNIFQQKGKGIAFHDPLGSPRHEIEGFLCPRKGEHGSSEVPIDVGETKMLAVPGHWHCIQNLIQ